MPNNNQVQFNQEGLYRPSSRGPRQSWPTRVLIQYGLAKDAQQAAIVQIIIAVLALAVMFFAWPRSNYEQVPQPVVEEESIAY